MTECIFCKIINGEISAARIYEDEHTYAFLDINPTNPGHTLVVPKKHFRNIFDTPEDTLARIMSTAKKIAPAIKSGTEADAINLIMNNERAAGQLVYHTHLHVIPRFEDDGFRHWKGTPYKEGEIDKVAEKITTMLSKTNSHPK
jgi:histidine triad (HIT) family protein